MKNRTKTVALNLALLTAVSGLSFVHTAESRTRRLRVKNLSEYAIKAQKEAPEAKLLQNRVAHTPSASSQKLALLRKKKGSLEETLNDTAHKIADLNDQVPDLERSRSATAQRIEKVRQRMVREKKSIAREIQKRASLYRQLRDIQKNKDMAIAQAKLQYLNNYGNRVNPRSHRAYRALIDKIKAYDVEINKLQEVVENFTEDGTSDAALTRRRNALM